MRHANIDSSQCSARSSHQMAFDLNSTIGPIIDGVVTLMPSILNLIVAVVPVIITLAVVGFVLGIFEMVLSKIKI